MSVPTVKIIGEDGNALVINSEDFDASKHKLYGSEDIVVAALQSTVQPAAPVTHDANGNPVNAGDGGSFVPPTQTPALRQDGPTVAEFVAAGYDPAAYPPAGYESRSTPEEIADAIAAKASGASKPADLMLVQKKGKKFLVVNLTGEPITREGIEADGYSTEAAALDAIKAVTGDKTA